MIARSTQGTITTEAFAGPEWPTRELLDWIAYYQRERAASIEADNDRTPGTVSYCEFRMHGMADEVLQRKRLAQRFRHDPAGPRWPTSGGKERSDLVELAQDLKSLWPVHKFLSELMRVELIPAGRNRWRCRCVSPAHRDAEPSMTVYDDGHVYCHGCTFYGDVIDLTALHFGLTSFKESVKRLAEASGLDGEGRST